MFQLPPPKRLSTVIKNILHQYIPQLFIREPKCLNGVGLGDRDGQYLQENYNICIDSF